MGGEGGGAPLCSHSGPNGSAHPPAVCGAWVCAVAPGGAPTGTWAADAAKGAESAPVDAEGKEQGVSGSVNGLDLCSTELFHNLSSEFFANDSNTLPPCCTPATPPPKLLIWGGGGAARGRGGLRMLKGQGSARGHRRRQEYSCGVWLRVAPFTPWGCGCSLLHP